MREAGYFSSNNSKTDYSGANDTAIRIELWLNDVQLELIEAP